MGLVGCVDIRGQSVFVGDSKGVLRQFSVGGQNLVHNFGKVNDRPIVSIVGWEGFVLVGDKYGYVKQFCGERRGIVKDYGKCNRDFVIGIMFYEAVGRSQKFMFIGDAGGALRQF